MSEEKNQLEATNYYLSESFHKSNSINNLLNNVSFVERMKSNNDEKESLKNTIEILMEVVNSIRNYGFLSLSNYIDKLTNPLAKHIIKLITRDYLPPIAALQEVALPYLLLSDMRGKELLESVLVYECIYDETVRGLEPTLIEHKLYAYLGMLS
jgi:hypothetical protein